MKKFLSLSFIGLYFTLQTAQAGIPDLGALGWATDKEKLDSGAKIIMAARFSDTFVSPIYGNASIQINNEELNKLKGIESSLMNDKAIEKEDYYSTVREALVNNTLTLTLNDLQFQLHDTKGNTATFNITLKRKRLK